VEGYQEKSNRADMIKLELSVDSLDSSLAAQAGGANRIELCSALREGGVTPSAGLIRSVRAAVTLGVFVIIRPRGGDFCYTPNEIRTIFEDIQEARALGVDGVVLGALTRDGHVAGRLTAEMVSAARPMQVTFHRAFDMTRDLDQALEDVIAAGVDRVLTSGGERDIVHGTETIQRLNVAARGRIALLAGGGLRRHNVGQFIRATGVEEVHSSLRARLPSLACYSNPRILLGEHAEEPVRYGVREQDVRRLREMLDSLAAEAKPTSVP
jgi:copper homeostasis protein